jgi:predicted metal-binding membrane protein
MPLPPRLTIQRNVSRDRVFRPGDRRRAVAGTAPLLAVTMLAWAWTVVMARDMYGTMSGAASWMMTDRWDTPHVFLLWAMWAVMMVAMMMPSAWPLLAVHANANRPAAPDGRSWTRTYALAAGYLTVWALFSLAAVVAQRLLAGLLLLTPMMEPASLGVGALLVLVAGVYQLTPFKRACLRRCRTLLPIGATDLPPREPGPAVLGFRHGIHCLGCCWALMLLLFAGGVMNLFAIVGLTVFVLAERTLPFGETASRISGALLVALGVSLLILRV